MPSALERKIKDRLMELSPRAFEFFAGDLLEFLGLTSVSVTRQAGDGGIDAVCEVVSGNLVHVPAGVQVKRRRQPVGRPDMDQFIGALANRYACGIYITTATFSRPSIQKAKAAVPYISVVNGDQVAEVLVKAGIGTKEDASTVDEEYFGGFEDRLKVAECSPTYRVGEPCDIAPADDFISLRALSYALHVDTTTIRAWVQRGQLQPDADGLYFRRRRVAEIRADFDLPGSPETSDAWVNAFLRFATQGKLNKSYKPVMLQALLDLVQGDGSIQVARLVEAFHDFYLERARSGLPAEASSSILCQPENARRSAVESLLIRYPLERFIIKGLLIYLPEERLIRFRPEIWGSLRYRDIVEIRRLLKKQIEDYFGSLKTT